MTDWPHAPVHRLGEPGVYFVTAGTYHKEHFFRTDDQLDQLQTLLFRLSAMYGFPLHAWAIFSNHYHFIATAEHEPALLRLMISEFHSVSARELNRVNRLKGRRVWYQYWDKQLTFERSYLARLNYVHQNPVHHRRVLQATNYHWCSASWFEARGRRACAASD